MKKELVEKNYEIEKKLLQLEKIEKLEADLNTQKSSITIKTKVIEELNSGKT